MPLLLADAAGWGALAIGITLGAMVFFSACVAPLVFMRLPPDIAGRFIRALFPWYYGFGFIGSSVAALLCAGTASTAAGFAFATALGFLLARQVLMPAINAARDAAMADPAAARRFERLHRASVAVNLVQVVLLLGAFMAAMAHA
jgi:hypothetical protein